MKKFNPWLQIPGAVFAVLAVVFSLVSNIPMLITYLSAAPQIVSQFIISTAISLAQIVLWAVVLIRGRKDVVSCVLLCILALEPLMNLSAFTMLAEAEANLLPYFIVRGFAGLCRFAATALLAIDCAVDFKWNTALRIILMTGSMILAALLSMAQPVLLNMSSNMHSPSIIITSLISVFSALPLYLTWIFTAGAIASARHQEGSVSQL